MLRLLPAPINGVRPAAPVSKTCCAEIAPKPARKPAHGPSSPAGGLVYTLLRHGHGLSHEEASRLLREALHESPGEPFQAA